jgi:hypothetical protein
MEVVAKDLSKVDFDETLKDGQEYKKVATFGADDDPRLQYDLVNKNEIQQKDLTENFLACEDKMDYMIPRDEEAIKKGHHCDLPISFLSIQEGDVETGKMWYLQHYPKLSEEMAELLARYNWGDMKFMTKKSAKNQRKKYEKKNNKKKPITECEQFTKKHGNFIVSFN